MNHMSHESALDPAFQDCVERAILQYNSLKTIRAANYLHTVIEISGLDTSVNLQNTYVELVFHSSLNPEFSILHQELGIPPTFLLLDPSSAKLKDCGLVKERPSTSPLEKNLTTTLVM